MSFRPLERKIQNPDERENWNLDHESKDGSGNPNRAGLDQRWDGREY